MADKTEELMDQINNDLGKDLLAKDGFHLLKDMNLEAYPTLKKKILGRKDISYDAQIVIIAAVLLSKRIVGSSADVSKNIVYDKKLMSAFSLKKDKRQAAILLIGVINQLTKARINFESIGLFLDKLPFKHAEKYAIIDTLDDIMPIFGVKKPVSKNIKEDTLKYLPQ